MFENEKMVQQVEIDHMELLVKALTDAVAQLPNLMEVVSDSDNENIKVILGRSKRKLRKMKLAALVAQLDAEEEVQE